MMAIQHYGRIHETEKAILFSLDGSEECAAWVPKSVILGPDQPRRRSRRDPLAQQTPIKNGWASHKVQSFGCIHPFEKV